MWAQDIKQNIYTCTPLVLISTGALQESRQLQCRLGNNAADCAIIVIFDTIDPS